MNPAVKGILGDGHGRRKKLFKRDGWSRHRAATRDQIRKGTHPEDANATVCRPVTSWDIT